MVSQGVIIASEVTGFISFVLTILTWLGVYRDLLGTMRNAPTQIPIMLGNLRQEILTEKAYLQFRIKQGDSFDVFPRSLRSIGVKGGMQQRRDAMKYQFSRLMEATVKDIWIEFRNLERPFLIKDPMRAEAVERGDYWGEDDVKEKPGMGRSSRGDQRRRGRNGERDRDPEKGGGVVDDSSPMRMTKESIQAVGARYYRTDMSHRFIWWQCKSDVVRLMDQLQRIQIRRLERDVFEADELVKRMCWKQGDGRGGNVGGGGGSGSDSPSGSDGGRRGSGKRGVARSRAGSVRSVRMPSRAGSRVGRNFREVEEVERVRRSVPSSPREVRQSDVEASNTGRRRERRGGPRVEYEVVRPGSVYVVDSGSARPAGRGYAYEEDSRGVERRGSYSRER